MTPFQRQRIIDSHRDALKRHGHHPNALLWSSTEIQEIRFKILSEIGIQTGDSILDVGCGFGDFSGYLTRQNINVEYTGIDLSEELLQAGRKQYPELSLFVGDLFDFEPEAKSYDYITLSGTLNRSFDDNGDYAFKLIKYMFDCCKKGIAFNLLDARHQWTATRWDLQSFHPDELIDFVKSLTDNHQIIDGYLDNDFTVYLWR